MPKRHDYGPLYTLQILTGEGGQANGINDQGWVVGLTYPNGMNNPSVGSWWTPLNDYAVQTFTEYDMAGPPNLVAIDDTGDIIPGSELLNINTPGNLPKQGATVPLQIISGAAAINNKSQIVSGNQLFNWAKKQSSTNPETIEPLTGQQDFAGYGINDLGDVVGQSGDLAAFAPASGGGKATVSVGPGRLNDINSNKIAVGQFYIGGFPAFVDCTVPNPHMQYFLVPYFGESNGFSPGIANAINNLGTVVGTGDSDESTVAFFYQYQTANKLTQATDLNGHIVGNSPNGWILTTATDINERGQIVGSATKDNQTRAYLLTPHSTLPPPG
jgi:uncharacterized membrane protein